MPWVIPLTEKNTATMLQIIISPVATTSCVYLPLKALEQVSPLTQSEAPYSSRTRRSRRRERDAVGVGGWGMGKGYPQPTKVVSSPARSGAERRRKTNLVLSRRHRTFLVARYRKSWEQRHIVQAKAQYATNINFPQKNFSVFFLEQALYIVDAPGYRGQWLLLPRDNDTVHVRNALHI